MVVFLNLQCEHTLYFGTKGISAYKLTFCALNLLLFMKYFVALVSFVTHLDEFCCVCIQCIASNISILWVMLKMPSFLTLDLFWSDSGSFVYFFQEFVLK
jgi:hypothetical protein